MSLTDKERQAIIEEEELRFQTRTRLAREQGHGAGCKGRAGRGWIWLGLIFLVLLAAHWFFSCGAFARCHDQAYGCQEFRCPYMQQQGGAMAPGQERSAPSRKGEASGR